MVLALAVLLFSACGVAMPLPVNASKFFWHPEMAPAGPVVVVVSLDEQEIYVYRSGVAIGISPISTGRTGHETPAGIYSILRKERDHHSNLYDDAPMPFMQRLTWNGVALHAGVLPGHPASHGCIRLPMAFAEALFGETQRGSVVVIANANVAPAFVVHPAAVAPIDLTGQPMSMASDPRHSDIMSVEGGVPLAILISTSDRAVYVFQSGRLLARSGLEMDTSFSLHGMFLYVLNAFESNDRNDESFPRGTTLWSAYRVLGSGEVPQPVELARRIKIPEPLARQLRQTLIPGTTVLVTDLPGMGGQSTPTFPDLLRSHGVSAE